MVITVSQKICDEPASSCAREFQTVVSSDLLAPLVSHLCLPGIVRPSRDGGANFLHDGLGPTAFHQGALRAGAKIGQSESVALPVERHLMCGSPTAGRVVAVGHIERGRE